MATWHSHSPAEDAPNRETPIRSLIASLKKRPPHQVSGTAVFLTADSTSAPTALLHSLKHYKVLHERNVILTVEISHIPTVPENERVLIEPLGPTFSRVLVKYGFMQQPNLPSALALVRKLGWNFDIMSTSFFLSRRTLKAASGSSEMPRWQEHLYIGLARSANDATDYFRLPTGRVVEVGTQVTV
jgi:KUP system potassium uptake protein